MGWARVALGSAMLLQAACGRQAESAGNNAEIRAAQERTMKEANDDVDAAMAEAAMTNGGAPANLITPSQR